jgi:hypothetical protein
MTQGGLAGRRDRRLKRAGAAYPVERRVVAAACLAILVAVAPILDSAGVLPGSSAGRYLACLLALFVLAAAPLSLFLEQLASQQDCPVIARFRHGLDRPAELGALYGGVNG